MEKKTLSKKYQEKLARLSKEYNAKVYDIDSFRDEFRSKIHAISLEWTRQINDEFKEDYGSCVLGAGFGVYVLYGPRYSTPKIYNFLSPNCRFQGSVTWETSAPNIEKLLKDAGIDCQYIWGRMD